MNKFPTTYNNATGNPPLSPETVRSLQELGEVLREIHNDLVSQGYIIKNGEIFKPESSDTNHGANN